MLNERLWVQIDCPSNYLIWVDLATENLTHHKFTFNEMCGSCIRGLQIHVDCRPAYFAPVYVPSFGYLHV